MKLTNERLHLVSTDVVIVNLEVQSKPATLWRDGDRRNDRQTVVPIPTIVDWRVASRSPGSTHHRLEHEAAFIDKNDATTGSSRFFLCAANPWCANVGSLLRLVREPVARAFGNSSPSASKYATRSKDRSGRRSGGESLGLPASGSTVRFCNRAWVGLASIAGPTFRVASLIGEAAGRDAVGH